MGESHVPYGASSDMLDWKLRVVMKELVEGSHGVQRLILIAVPIAIKGKALQRLSQTETGHQSWDIQLPVRAQTDAKSKAPSSHVLAPGRCAMGK